MNPHSVSATQQLAAAAASKLSPSKGDAIEVADWLLLKLLGHQRRAYGYRDEEYFKLKIVAAFLPPLPRNANITPHTSA